MAAPVLPPHVLPHFSFKELGLTKVGLCGVGKDKKVYKALSQDQTPYAVSKLNLNESLIIKLTNETLLLHFFAGDPHIVPLFSSGVYWSAKKNTFRSYQLMPFYERTLKQANESLRPDQRVQVLFEVALGLRSLHTKRIVYCDLNATNVMLRPYHEEGELKFSAVLIDFLGATTEGEDFSQKEFTLMYASPEMLHHFCKMPYYKNGTFRHQITCAADIWSLGILYFTTLWKQDLMVENNNYPIRTYYIQLLNQAHLIHQKINEIKVSEVTSELVKEVFSLSETSLAIYRRAVLSFEAMVEEFKNALPDEQEGNFVKRCLDLDPLTRLPIDAVLENLQHIKMS